MSETDEMQDVIQEGSKEEDDTEEDEQEENHIGSFDSGKVRLGFNLKKKVPFGCAVYVFGGIPSLGSWVVSQALRLEWSEGHNWYRSFVIKIGDKDCSFKYKYFISDFEMTKESPIIWEPGINRTFNAKLSLKYVVQVEDVWGWFKITFRLALTDSISSVYVAVGDSSVGYEEAHPARMYQRILREVYSGAAQYWERDLEIPCDIEKVEYRYGVKLKKNSMIRWERESNRHFYLKEAKYYIDQEYDSFRDTIGTKTKNTSFTYKNSIYIRMDHDFNDDFVFSEISNHLLIGPYPKYEEIEKLRPNGCNCIINLQTKEELEDLILSSETYDEVCKKNGIKFYHMPLPTPDWSPQETYNASKLLNECISKYKRVYIHCTNGLHRSVAVTILYYHLFQELPLKKAIELTLSKRWRSTVTEEEIIQLIRSIKASPRSRKQQISLGIVNSSIRY